MKKASKRKPDSEMRAEYDFSGGVRGKFYRQYMEGSNIVVLAPDVFPFYHDSKSVNRALRTLLKERKTAAG